MFRTVPLSETRRILFPKNKFEKLVYLVGFIITIHHDARPPVRDTNNALLQGIKREGAS